MSTYRRLTREERYQIAALGKAGQTSAQIACVLGRHKSTISRELRRNAGQRGYRPKQADEKAWARSRAKYRYRLPKTVQPRVSELLRRKWSPEQISGWLLREEGVRVSHEWIYRYVRQDRRQGGDLHTHLRCRRKRRRRYGRAGEDRRGQIKDRVSIEQRPALVDRRNGIGDWEADTVIGTPSGPKPVLVTPTERKSRFSVIVKGVNKTAQAVSQAITAALTPLKDWVHTLTYDNGKEFAWHRQISEVLDAQGFFAHPYRSWERGLNENTNGLLRQHFPKRTDFSESTQEHVQNVMDALNDRPRKCLGWKTPHHAFFGNHLNGALAC